ncbi:MAG: O-antigen polymerase [Pseudomonadota bacterium]|nr:O-antigen polymerase [Pseudomonadota bacterium]
MKFVSYNNYINISQSLFLIVSFIMFILSPDGWNTSFVNTIIFLTLLLFFNQVLICKFIKKEKGIIQLELVFFMMFFFTILWIWFAGFIGLAEIGRLPQGYDEVVNYSVSLSFFAISTFLFAYNLHHKQVKGNDTNFLSRKNKGWIRVGNIIFYSGVLMVFLYVFVFGTASFIGSYIGHEGNLLTRALYLLQSIFVKVGIIICLVTQSDKTRRMPKIKHHIIPFGFVLLMYVFTGDRSELIFTLATAVFAYSVSFKHIPLSVVLVGVLVLGILSSAVRIFREYDERTLGSLVELILNPSEEVSVEGGVANIASSGLLLLAATNAVPEKFDYFNGKLKVMEALGVIPFGRFFFGDFAGASHYEKKDYNTSFWLTWLVIGPQATWGVGTNIVADLYIDFGPLGVFLGMYFLGFLGGYFKTRFHVSNSLVFIFMYCYFAGFMTILPRYGILSIIRGLLWPFLLIKLSEYFFRVKKKTAK